MPLPPAPSATPLGQRPMVAAAEVPQDRAGQFAWGWWLLPIPWVDEGNTSNSVFPLPVARLAADWQGTSILLSATALWHLLPATMGESRAVV
eukprot:7921095-Alexandrium_andersonii.AAC.1